MLRMIWVRKLVAVLAVLAAANGLAYVAGQFLAEPVTYASRDIQFVADTIDERSRGGCTDVIVGGNSASFYGVSPTLLAEESQFDSALSVGIPLSIASTDVVWFRDIAIPRTDPSVVVWMSSVASLLPEDAVAGSVVTLGTRAPATSKSEGAALDRFLSDYSPLIRERPALTNFEAIVEQIKGNLPENGTEAAAAAPGLSLDPDGHVRSSRVWTPALVDLEQFRGELSQLTPDWPVDGAQAIEMADYLTELQAEGRTTVVVIPPITAALVELLPGGPLNYERHVDAARQVAERSGSILIDESEGAYIDAEFSDLYHLNATGAETLTTRIAQELEEVDAKPCG